MSITVTSGLKVPATSEQKTFVGCERLELKYICIRENCEFTARKKWFWCDFACKKSTFYRR